jgi:hypothetical protein
MHGGVIALHPQAAKFHWFSIMFPLCDTQKKMTRMEESPPPLHHYTPLIDAHTRTPVRDYASGYGRGRVCMASMTIMQWERKRNYKKKLNTFVESTQPFRTRVRKGQRKGRKNTTLIPIVS